MAYLPFPLQDEYLVHSKSSLVPVFTGEKWEVCRGTNQLLTELTVWRFLLKKQVKIYHLLFITFLRVQLDMGTLASDFCVDQMDPETS